MLIPGIRDSVRQDELEWVLRSTMPQNGFDYDEVFINGFGRPAYGSGIHLLGGVRYPLAGGNDRPLSVTSTDDGLTWTRTDLSGTPSMPANTVLELVAYGDGVFVGVAQQYGTMTGLKFCTSVDGVNWTVGNDGGFTPTAHVNAISHNGQTGGSGLFVAVGRVNGVAAVATSPDGVTWTQRGNGGFTRAGAFDNPAIPNFVEHNKQAGANGLWVAQSDLQLCSSPDGITWTERLYGTDGWFAAAYGSGTLVAISSQGSSTQKVKTSTDGGLTWTVRTAVSNASWKSVAYGAGLFVAVSSTGTVMTSPDGITWTSRTAAAANQWNSVCWSPDLSLFVAVASSGAGNRVMTSPDGITWTIRVSAANNAWQAVTWSSSAAIFVAVSNSGTGNRVMTSPDGITWTIRVSSSDQLYTCVFFGAGLFVALAGGTTYMTSPDGVAWTTQTSLPTTSWKSLIFAESLFVASGNAGIITSADGLSWTDPPTSIGGLGAMAYDGSSFVFIGFSNETEISADGSTWTYYPGYVNRTFFSGITHNGLAAPNGLWVAAYDAQEPPLDGTGFMTSPDGITWTFQHVGDPGVGIGGADICGLAYGNGMWVALINGGADSQYATSEDGLTWEPLFDPLLFTYETDKGVLGFGNGVFIGTYYDINLIYRYGPPENPDVRWIFGPEVDYGNERLTAEGLDGFVYTQAAQNRLEGKYYFEVELNNEINGIGISASINDAETGPGENAKDWCFKVGAAVAQKINNNVATSYGTNASDGAVIGVLLDLDAGEIRFSIDGVDQGVAFTGVSGDAYGLFPREYMGSTGTAVTGRFTRTDMEYIPPGYLAWDGT